jgi:hypothetical protein
MLHAIAATAASAASTTSGQFNLAIISDVGILQKQQNADFICRPFNLLLESAHYFVRILHDFIAAICHGKYSVTQAPA